MMRFLVALLFIGFVVARHEGGCHCENGCGPGYEKSWLDYAGEFQGGARKYHPTYQKIQSHQHSCTVKGGCGAHPSHGYRYKRHCQCEKGCGPGYEKSWLDYAGVFQGGARKYQPTYQRIQSHQHSCTVKGGCGAHPCHGCRYKRHCQCEKGCGPGYEKSWLDYAGKFQGGSRKFHPTYQTIQSSQHSCTVKGGCGARLRRANSCGCRFI